MKHTKQFLAVAISTGLLLLAACEKTKLDAAEPITQPTTAANIAFATLKQPDGKPINPHLATMVALCIEKANKFNRFYNKLTSAQ